MFLRNRIVQSSLQRAPRTDEGFAKQSDENTAGDGETINRASGGSFRNLGNCFFVPAVNNIQIGQQSDRSAS